PMSLVGPARPSEPATSDASASAVLSREAATPQDQGDNTIASTQPNQSKSMMRNTPSPKRSKRQKAAKDSAPACTSARANVQRGKTQQDWKLIAEATRMYPTCWPEVERLQLRIRALRHL